MQTTDLTSYKHCTVVNVRFMDLDALQHVNNARYLNFLEEARLSYSQEMLNTFNRIEELNVLVARVEIDFMQPIHYRDLVKVYTKISNIGNKSFVFDSLITTTVKNKENIAAKALQTLVAFDPKTKTTISIPEDLRKQIIEIEPQLS